MVLPLRSGKPPAAINEELGVAQLRNREIATINHLRGLSVETVSDFADGYQFAFLGSFDKLGRNPAQRRGDCSGAQSGKAFRGSWSRSAVP